MNEINFEIQDAETINFSMDVGIKELYPPIENLEVNPSGQKQVFNHENSYGYDIVTVNAIETEQLDITPTKEEQNFSGIYDNVKVGAVTSEVDENITPDNIKLGVDVLGVTGTFAGEKYAPKHISFRGTSSLTNLDYEVSQLDTKNITDMKYMFYGDSSLETINLSSWNFENVTSMQQMFYNNIKITSIIFGNANTNKLTDMGNIFYNARTLTTLDIANMNTSSLRSLRYAFYSCYELKTIDIKNWDVTNLIDMDNCFYYCTKLIDLDLSRWVTTNKFKVIKSAFYNCMYLTRLDLRGFVTDSVTNMDATFGQCYSLKYLDIRNFNFSNVTSSTNTFKGMPADCEIIVKDDTARDWILSHSTNGFTNIKTVAEL